MSPLEFQGELLDDHGKLADALRNLLESRRRPRRVHVLTHTLGPFDVGGGTAFLVKLRHLISNEAVVVVLFGDPMSAPTPEKKAFINDLLGNGVKVFHNPHMHAKLILIEGHDQGSFYLGSANMTQSGVWKNHELGIKSEALEPNTYEALKGYVENKLKASQTRAVDDEWVRSW